MSGEASRRLPAATVDVIVPTLDEERHVAKCLRAVLTQDYPPDLLRVVLVDSGSSDRTVAVAQAVADPRLTVLAGLGRLALPAALNAALGHCRGDLVAKIDAHGYPEPDFIRRAVDDLAASPADVAVVGGRFVQHGETPWGEAVARARASRFGTGGSIYAAGQAREYVDSVSCGVYRRDVLVGVGGFDVTMAYGEDDELNWRLRERGYRVLFDPAMRFHYVARGAPRSLLLQYLRYGRARVRVAALHPEFVRPWHLAPAALVAGGTGLAVLAPFSRAARRLLSAAAAAYGVLAVSCAVATPGPRAPAAVARVAACFPIIHVGHGAGFLSAARDRLLWERASRGGGSPAGPLRRLRAAPTPPRTSA